MYNVFAYVYKLGLGVCISCNKKWYFKFVYICYLFTGEGRGKSLDEGSTGPIVVENFGGGLCPAVDVPRLR
jgi:hypothetical protein